MNFLEQLTRLNDFWNRDGILCCDLTGHQLQYGATLLVKHLLESDPLVDWSRYAVSPALCMRFRRAANHKIGGSYGTSKCEAAIQNRAGLIRARFGELNRWLENPWIVTYQFVVPAKQNQNDPLSTRIRLEAGEVFIIEPDPDGRWGAHGPDGRMTDYRGWGRTDSLGTLFWRIESAESAVTAGRPISVISTGELQLYCHDQEPSDNVGEIRVELIRLQTEN